MNNKHIDGQAISSNGQAQTEGRYQDKHYECFKAEYDATLPAAGIKLDFDDPIEGLRFKSRPQCQLYM